MNAQELEHQLAFDIAEHVPLPGDPWPRVTAGELTPQQAVDMLREADPTLDSEQLEQHARLFAPASAEDRQHELEMVLQTRFRSRGSSADAPASASGQRPSRLRRHRGLLVTGGTVGLAAAAAAALAFIPRDPGPTEPSDAVAAEPLPPYALAWKSWSGHALGPDDDLPPGCSAQLHRGLDLKVTLRPASEVSTQVAVAAWAEGKDAARRSLKLSPRIDPSGVIHIEQPVRALGLTPGEWTLTFIVGPPERLPSMEALAELRPGRDSGLVILRDIVCVVE